MDKNKNTNKAKNHNNQNQQTSKNGRKIFEESINIFGEKLKKLRTENSIDFSDTIKYDLRKQTMSIYRNKYCHGLTSQENAKRILNDVNTFKGKSWIQQINLATNMVRVNVLKRISKYEALPEINSTNKNNNLTHSNDYTVH